MKVTQIIAESTKKPVSEAPAGALGQFGKKVLAKTAAKVGAKNFAAGVAGNVDTGAEANELRKNWQSHQGSIGGSMSANDPAEFKQWLLNNGFKGKDKVIDKAMADNKIEGPFGKGPLDKALLQIVQDSKKASAGAEEQPQDDKAQQQGQQQGKGNQQGQGDQQGQGTGQGTGELNPDIQKQIDQATKGEKATAVALLKKGTKPTAPKPSAETPGATKDAPADAKASAKEPTGVKPGDVVTSAAGNKVLAGVDGTPTVVKPGDAKGKAEIMKAAGKGVDTPQKQPAPKVTKKVTSKAAQNNTKSNLKFGTPDNPTTGPAVQGTT